MDVDVRTLRTFCAVVRNGSFTAAARRLGYAQSSVTAQIRALEKQVGEPVFQRLPSGVRLTPAGLTLRGYAQQLLGLVGEMEEALRSPAAAPQLVLGLPTALAHGELLARTARFGRLLLPGVRLAVRTVGAGEIHAALRAGSLDGALVLAGGGAGRDGTATAAPAPGPVRAEPPGVRRLPHLPQPDGPAVPASPRARSRPPGRLSECTLPEAEFVPVAGPGGSRPARGRTGPWPAGRAVVADPDCPSQLWLPEYLGLRSGEPPERLETASIDGVRAAVRTGLGYAMLPAEIAGTEPGGGLTRLPGVPRMRWPLSLVTGGAGDTGELHREGLAEVLRLALAASPGDRPVTTAPLTAAAAAGAA